MKIKNQLFLFLALSSCFYASAQCTANWGYSSSSSSINFYDSSSSSGGRITNWYWDFGDGSTSTSINPSHKYNSVGTFNVCLYVTDSSTRCTDSKCINITIGGSRSGCDSTFNYYTVGDSLYYSYNLSANNVRWDFGDGKTSTSLSGIHKYSKTGKYTLCMTAKCSSTDSSKMCLSITITQKCKASFITALDTTKKFKLFLINKSSNSSTTSYYWDFGDGGSSTSRNPTHKYKTFGKFYVCLTLIDSATRCYSNFCDTVGLDSNGKLLKASSWDLEVMEESLFGINKLLKSDIKVYPNPSNSKIMIDLSKANLLYDKLEVINANGQICLQETVFKGNETLELNVGNLNPGLYLIKLSNEQGYSFTKMIKN